MEFDLITIAITVGSLGMNVVLASVTWIQHRTHRQEIKSRLRPWIGRKDDAKITDEQLIIPIYNHGSTPATDMKIEYYVGDYTGVESSDDNIEFVILKDKLTLVPSELFRLLIPTNRRQPYDFGLRIHYRIPESGESADRLYEIIGYCKDDKVYTISNNAS